MKRALTLSAAIIAAACLIPLSCFAEGGIVLGEGEQYLGPVTGAETTAAETTAEETEEPVSPDADADAGAGAGVADAETTTEFQAPATYPAALAPQYAPATDDGIAYLTAQDGTVTVVGYRGDGGKVIIPSEIGGGAVTAVADTAFFGVTSVTEVVLPDSVTVIGEEAFSQMTALKAVTLPSSLAAIPDRAFASSAELRKISLPASLTSIGTEAFANCRYLRSLTVPSGVTAIGDDAFAGCESLMLDVSSNEYARTYAQANGLETSFSTSFYAMILVCCGIAAVLAAAFFALRHMFSRTKAKARRE